MNSILFVCIENSCRSQMAEGFARFHGNDQWEVWSAGSKPSGKINQTAIQVMEEKGIVLTHQKSKGLSDLPIQKWDYVVTMGCGDACPQIEAIHRVEWEIRDPKNLPLFEFRLVRDEIERKVQELAESL